MEKGELVKDPRAMVDALEERWRQQEFPSIAVSTAFFTLAKDHMLRNWFENYAERPAAAIERFFEFEFEGANVIGYIDRIGPAVQDGYVITDFKTGKSDSAGPPRDSLQLGIYYLAVQESPDLAEFQPVKTVELAFLRGNWKSPNIDYRKWMVTERDEEAYQAEMRERLATLIARKRDLNETRGVPSEPVCELPLLRLPDALPAVRGRAARVLRRVGPRRSARAGAGMSAVVPTRDRRRDGRCAAHRRAVARDHDAARAVRADRRRRIGQDVRDGRARRVPGAGGARAGRRPTSTACCPATCSA